MKPDQELMKALRIEKPGETKVVDIEKPIAGEAELLLRLKYVGFCGSDLNTFLGKNPMVRYPRVPGHEISAEIAEAGRGVPDGFSPGEAVTVIPYTSCGKCPSCRRGREYACRFNQTLGIQRDGAMLEYLAVPWQKVLKAPALDAQALAMVEPLTVGFHAIERGRITASDTVVVMGCGMIGAGAILAASNRGAKVIAVDIDDHKLVLAGKLGARYPINSKDADLHNALSDITGGDGPDVVVEAVGSPLTYTAAVEEVAFTGRIVCIGYAGDDVSLSTRLFVQKELDILGSRNATVDDFRAVISCLEQENYHVDSLITHKTGFSGAGQALKQWADDPGRVMKILLDINL